MPKGDSTNWTVVGEPFKRDKAWWVLCRCRCGREKEVRRNAVVFCQSTSCGKCGVNRDGGRRGYKHGKHDTSEYATWFNIKSRCHNPEDEQYHNYGGRGITVCARWLGDKVAFLNDMGPKPAGRERYGIERIDNDKGYWCGKPECPECGPAGRSPNCKWDTVANGQRNRRNNRLITHNGVTKCLVEWATELGIEAGAFAGRLDMGWDFDRAATTPIAAKCVLSDDQVREILRAYKPNTRGSGPHSLAVLYGVSVQTIQRIVAGEIQRYRHLYDAHHRVTESPS